MALLLGPDPAPPPSETALSVLDGPTIVRSGTRSAWSNDVPLPTCLGRTRRRDWAGSHHTWPWHCTPSRRCSSSVVSPEAVSRSSALEVSGKDLAFLVPWNENMVGVERCLGSLLAISSSEKVPRFVEVVHCIPVVYGTATADCRCLEQNSGFQGM